MSASPSTVNESTIEAWTAHNQRWLSARFAFWRERLERHDDASAPVSTPTFDDAGNLQPAALQIRTLFGLTPFETDVLVLAAGVEIDSALRSVVARVQGMAARQPVALTFSLALALLPEPHWDALAPQRPLRHWLLLELDTSTGLAQAAGRIDERILHYLTGVAVVDERLGGVARLNDMTVDSGNDDLAAAIALAMTDARDPLVMLSNATAEPGRRRTGRALARAAFEQAGLDTLWIDTAAIPTDPRELSEIARRIDREAALTGAGLALVFDPEAPWAPVAARLIATLRSPIVTLGALTSLQLADLPHRRAVRFDVPTQHASPVAGLPPAVARAASRALQQFHVDTAVLDQALASATALGGDDNLEERIWDGLREAARGGLDALAQRIDSRATFEDVVVPAPVSAQLREIASQLRHRQQVYEEWGFGDRDKRGLGIAALFAGESGTGKTLAAEAIANAAQLDLYRIDLASVISKYIGETEKNLARLFDAAERSGAVLLFDEADALFGKRSEVKDSHDRYANIEVAYLLQRVESYRGLAVLTTNMKSALDRSFLRRIRFIVHFPFPDEAAREQIWHLQFPPRAPVDGINYAALAKLQLSGGHIRSVALNAAFRAAARGTPIEQRDVVASARVEFAKLERTFTPPPGIAV